MIRCLKTLIIQKQSPTFNITHQPHINLIFKPSGQKPSQKVHRAEVDPQF